LRGNRLVKLFKVGSFLYLDESFIQNYSTLKLVGAALPVRRTTLDVKACKNDDNVSFDEVEERIRELTHKRATDLLMHYLMRVWVTLHTGQTSICNTKKLEP
jgi:hypothetical protein